MSTPFKMKGFSGFGNSSSPMQMQRQMKGADVTGWGGILESGAKFEGKEGSTMTSLTPKKQFGYDKKFSIGAKFTGKSKSGLTRLSVVDPIRGFDSQASLTTKQKFGGGRGPHGYHTGFKGSISGEGGVRGMGMFKKGGKGTYKGRLDMGIGNKDWNLKAFGEHASKHHIEGGGTKFGISGGMNKGFKGSIGYNIKTKKPEFGLSIGI